MVLHLGPKFEVILWNCSRSYCLDSLESAQTAFDVAISTESNDTSTGVSTVGRSTNTSNATRTTELVLWILLTTRAMWFPSRDWESAYFKTRILSSTINSTVTRAPFGFFTKNRKSKVDSNEAGRMPSLNERLMLDENLDESGSAGVCKLIEPSLRSIENLLLIAVDEIDLGALAGVNTASVQSVVAEAALSGADCAWHA